PLLYSLPANVENLNVTMGASLKDFPATVFFEMLFSIHLHNTETLYYKDILSILNHPLGIALVPQSHNITKKIIQENITHVAASAFFEFSENEGNTILYHLFGDWNKEIKNALNAVTAILEAVQHQ